MKNLSETKIVAIGGGTGLSTMLRGVKRFTSNINVIVTVSDDGGSSGVLREEMNILPPGDIRNCIVALANTEDMLKKLFGYRFDCGKLKGHSFGNLFLAAMTDLTGDFENAIEQMSSVLAVKGHVLPVTKEDVYIKAVLKNGNQVFGESNIPKVCIAENSAVDRIIMEPSSAKAFGKCIDAIMDADLVILGPGSLYTSIIPNLLIDGITDALMSTSAKKVYVCNVMTQPGETDGYNALDHVHAIERHSAKGIVDVCIANNAVLDEKTLVRYLSQRSEPVVADENSFKREGIQLIADNLIYIDENDKVRHNYIRLADIILSQISPSSKTENITE